MRFRWKAAIAIEREALSPPSRRCLRALRLVFLGLFFARLAGGQPEIPVEEGVETSRADLAELMDEALLAAMEEVDWDALGGAITEALESDQWEELAALLPTAREVLAWLRTVPAAEPFVAWLEPRMDFLEWADEIWREEVAWRAAPPSPPPRVTPLPRRPEAWPRPGPAPALKPPCARERAALDPKSWEPRIRFRPCPAGAEQWVSPLKAVFREEGVPPEWVWLAEVESSMNPHARSPAGAVGLFQLMPATAHRFGLRTQPRDERLDPVISGRAAARYLKLLHNLFGDWPLAIAAYNAGEGRVKRALARAPARAFEAAAAYLPVETRLYVPKVLATVAVREGVDPVALPPPASGR